VAQALAAAKGLTVYEVAEATRVNFERLFGLPAPARDGVAEAGRD
jgi:hypothetical protein